MAGGLALACAHEPQQQHSAQNAPPPLPYAPAPLNTSTAVAPPPSDEQPLTPASGTGGRRANFAPSTPSPSPAQAMPGDVAMNQAETPRDQESIREIRAALATDRSLSQT